MLTRRLRGVIVLVAAVSASCLGSAADPGSAVPARGGAPSASNAPVPTTPPSPGPEPSAAPARPSRAIDIRRVELPTRPDVAFEATAGPAIELDDRAGTGVLEPIVATHPTDPSLMALAFTRSVPAEEGARLAASLRVSRDGGRTWADTRRLPWGGSGRRPSLHSAIAWGPGPADAARLYWVGTTTGDGVRVAIAHSDDLGTTWSRLQVVRDTPAWVGGFPDITVDRDPASPAYGAAYVAYAYPAPKGRGAGIRVLASTDLGRTWRGTNVPRAPGERRLPVSWRFGPRVRTGPDGSVYVSSYQADLRAWDAGDVFDRGGPANAGRVGFTLTRLLHDPATGRLVSGPTRMATTVARNGWTTSRRTAPGTRTHTYLDPMWSHGLDVDRVTGRVYLAVADVSARPEGGQPRGSVRVGRSDDQGGTWTWVGVPRVPDIDGQRQSSFRPTLVVSGGLVLVGLHSIDDVPTKRAWVADARIGTAVAVSADGARSFAVPVPVTGERWRASSLERAVNGPGLRDRAEVTADGRVVYAYGDGRVAPTGPARAAGHAQVFVALIALVRGDPSRRAGWHPR